MRITYLNGTRLKRAFIAGSRKVIQRRDHLNRINVFPVADSDTGTNMAETLATMVNRLLGVREPALYSIARLAADSALEGARGNSGTILAQFFYGLAEEVGSETRLTTSHFADAARNAVDYAYRAIASPKEGTILTVLREWSRSLHGGGGKTRDFQELLVGSLEPTRASLFATQDRLEELRRAGVVDAGAQGFVDMLEGIVAYMDSGRIRELEDFQPEVIGGEHEDAVEAAASLTFRYCTECVLENAAIDQDSLRGILGGFGDSVIVAGSAKKTKIHVHTDTPAELFELLTEQGRVVRQKIDDMQRQYRAAHSERRECALVVDSTCDLPQSVLESLNIHVVPTHLVFGDAMFIDRLGITARRFFEMMRARPDIVPSTSQPAPGEFARTFKFLTDHFRDVLYLGLSGALSGTLQSAQVAAQSLGTRVTVLDTRQASIGSGLAARRVGEAIRDGASLTEAVRLAQSLLTRTRLFMTVPSLETLKRGGRIGKGQGWIGELLNVKPVLSLSPSGKITPVAAVIGEQASRKRILKLAERFLDGRSADFAVAHAGAPEAARWFESSIRERFRLAREPYVIEVSPVLAAHLGLGTVGIACTIREGDETR